MLYEIINPSDRCYISADDETLAIAACILLGNGTYGLMCCESREVVLCPFGISVFDSENHKLEDYVNEKSSELAEVLKSFHYAYERSSCNNIAARAAALAKALGGM